MREAKEKQAENRRRNKEGEWKAASNSTRYHIAYTRRDAQRVAKRKRNWSRKLLRVAAAAAAAQLEVGANYSELKLRACKWGCCSSRNKRRGSKRDAQAGSKYVKVHTTRHMRVGKKEGRTLWSCSWSGTGRSSSRPQELQQICQFVARQLAGTGCELGSWEVEGEGGATAASVYLKPPLGADLGGETLERILRSNWNLIAT